MPLATRKTLQISATPRDYQSAFAADYKQAVMNAAAGTSHLYSAFMGSGKSLCALLAHEADPEMALVTPRLEIISGILEKGGYAKEEIKTWSDNRLAQTALEYGVTTPVRMRNMLMKGEYPFPFPRRLCIDEAHHDLAETYQQIRAFLPATTVFGLTATPFRGTPKGTKEFLDKWDTLTPIIKLKELFDRGLVSIPEAEIWPLLDDDQIEVTNGDFRTVETGQALKPMLEEVAERCRGFVSYLVDSPHNRWDMPTLFAVPTTDSVLDLVNRLNALGLPAVGVTQDTPRDMRNKAFENCIACKVAIVQIDVVSEGVDLPIRRLIDLRPTMSPVKWLQQVGRITRPGAKSYYICCCRNLERHSYLMNGYFPAHKVAEAQKVFEKSTKRAGSRVVGMENLGKFKGAEILLADGCTGTIYSIYSVGADFTKTCYSILCHPAVEKPLVATCTHIGDGEGKVQWGKWKRIDEVPADLKGFQSTPPKAITENQQKWWSRDATKFGIARDEEPSRKTFNALPVLANCSPNPAKRLRFAVGGF